MKRHDNPAADFVLTLFNQKTQNRIPITSVPAGSEFLIQGEYNPSTSLASPNSGGPAPSTSGCPAPSTSGGPAPSTLGGPAPSISRGPVPSTSRGTAPSFSRGPAPSTSRDPAPFISRGPSTSGGPAPSTSGGPAPSTSRGPAPSISRGPVPFTSRGPTPSSLRGPAPFYSRGPAPSGSRGPAPSTSRGAFGAKPFTGCKSSLSSEWEVMAILPPGSGHRVTSKRLISGVPGRTSLKPIPISFKPGNWSPQMEEPGNLVRQHSSSVGDLRQKTFQHSGIGGIPQGKPNLQAGFSQMAGQSPREPPIHRNQYPIFQQPYPRPNAAAEKRASSTSNNQPPAKKLWKFRNVDKQTYTAGKSSAVMPPSVMVKTPAKPVSDNSMKILTVDIDGMKHWSQFKDKIPIIFELYGTLDSSITEGEFGAKNFFIYDGRQVVKCAFYENDRELPPLMRPDIVRCVGNYDRAKELMTCFSVRIGRPTEVRNYRVVIKACDAEMATLVENFSKP